METNTGQTASEYLTILAVVIVVALIVVGVMGGIPGIGNHYTRSAFCKDQYNGSFAIYENPGSEDRDFYCHSEGINNNFDIDRSNVFVTDNEYQVWKNSSINAEK